ncbi:MAG: hypothetical protein ABW023_05995 [Sphingomonas sp.]
MSRENIMPKLTNKVILAGLDAAANRTGVPSLVLGHARRRHLRWLPIVALALGTIGFGLGLVRTDLVHVAYGVISAGFVIGVMLPLFGPIKPWGGAQLADEFDRAVRQRAFLAAFASVTFASFIGIWLLIGLALAQHWDGFALAMQLRNLVHYLVVFYFTVPTLHASWATQPVGEEE